MSRDTNHSRNDIEISGLPSLPKDLQRVDVGTPEFSDGVARTIMVGYKMKEQEA